MKWTTKLPSEPGWYWFRGDHYYQDIDPVVTYVGTLDYDDSLVAQQPFMDYADSLDQFDGEWYGPIPAPE